MNYVWKCGCEFKVGLIVYVYNMTTCLIQSLSRDLLVCGWPINHIYTTLVVP